MENDNKWKWMYFIFMDLDLKPLLLALLLNWAAFSYVQQYGANLASNHHAIHQLRSELVICGKKVPNLSQSLIKDIKKLERALKELIDITKASNLSQGLIKEMTELGKALKELCITTTKAPDINININKGIKEEAIRKMIDELMLGIGMEINARNWDRNWDGDYVRYFNN